MQIFEITEKTNKIEEFVTSNEINLLINQRFLLNKEIDNFIELYVHKIACFHLNRIGLLFDENKHIEFTFYNKNYLINNYILSNSFIIDNEIISPIGTTITYFYDDDNSTTVIANISYAKYKYKGFFDDDFKLTFSLPRKKKQIYFDDIENYYYRCKVHELNNDMELIIKIWERKPDIPYFYFNNYIIQQLKLDKSSFDIDINEKNDIINKINITEEKYVELFTLNFIDELIYSLNFDNLSKLTSLFKEYNNDNFIIIQKKLTQNDDNFLNKNNPSSPKFQNSKILVENDCRFIQRLHISNYYTKAICNWIIQEIVHSELEWNNDAKYHYIVSEKIPEVFNFILISIRNIITEVNKFYGLNNSTDYKIKDILFIKYDNNILLNSILPNSNFSSDNSCFIFKILLSDINEFSGGNISFEDYNLKYMDTGDIIIHNGFLKYYEKSITTGEKIYLLFKLDAYNTEDEDHYWWKHYIKEYYIT